MVITIAWRAAAGAVIGLLAVYGLGEDGPLSYRGFLPCRSTGLGQLGRGALTKTYNLYIYIYIYIYLTSQAGRRSNLSC